MQNASRGYIVHVSFCRTLVVMYSTSTRQQECKHYRCDGIVPRDHSRSPGPRLEYELPIRFAPVDFIYSGPYLVNMSTFTSFAFSNFGQTSNPVFENTSVRLNTVNSNPSTIRAPESVSQLLDRREQLEKDGSGHANATTTYQAIFETSKKVQMTNAPRLRSSSAKTLAARLAHPQSAS